VKTQVVHYTHPTPPMAKRIQETIDI